MRVITAQDLDGLDAALLWNIGAHADSTFAVLRLILRRRCCVREMRRTQRQNQEKWLASFCGTLDETTRVVCLGDSVVAGPVLRRLIIVLIVKRVIVLVCALARFPVFEPKALLGWNIGEPPAVLTIGATVQMPLTDI